MFCRIEVHDGPVRAQTFWYRQGDVLSWSLINNEGRVNTHLDVVGIDHRQVAEDRPRLYVSRRAAIAHEQQENIPGKEIVDG